MSAAFLIREPAAERVKVKRDGPRGWHWISAATFDPSKHELADGPAPAQQEAAPAAAPVKRPPGRPRSKHLNTEAINGDR